MKREEQAAHVARFHSINVQYQITCQSHFLLSFIILVIYVCSCLAYYCTRWKGAFHTQFVREWILTGWEMFCFVWYLYMRPAYSLFISFSLPLSLSLSLSPSLSLSRMMRSQTRHTYPTCYGSNRNLPFDSSKRWSFINWQFTTILPWQVRKLNLECLHKKRPQYIRDLYNC